MKTHRTCRVEWSTLQMLDYKYTLKSGPLRKVSWKLECSFSSVSWPLAYIMPQVLHFVKLKSAYIDIPLSTRRNCSKNQVACLVQQLNDIRHSLPAQTSLLDLHLSDIHLYSGSCMSRMSQDCLALPISVLHTRRWIAYWPSILLRDQLNFWTAVRQAPDWRGDKNFTWPKSRCIWVRGLLGPSLLPSMHGRLTSMQSSTWCNWAPPFLTGATFSWPTFVSPAKTASEATLALSLQKEIWNHLVNLHQPFLYQHFCHWPQIPPIQETRADISCLACTLKEVHIQNKGNGKNLLNLALARVFINRAGQEPMM